MKRGTAKNMLFGCMIGRGSYDGANVTCLSCQKQGVACPFGGAPVKSPATDEISQSAPTEDEGVKRKEPNKTEAAYLRVLGMEFPGARIRYEEITLHLDNGHAYTPDAVVTFPDGSMLLVEIKPAKGKNGFRHGSYQRAKCMFDQCVVDYPHWSWRWAEKAGASWDVKTIGAKITKGER